MGAEDHKSKAPKSVKIAVITVSDTRTDKDDFSGNAIMDIARLSGHESLRKVIVKDSPDDIQKALREMLEDSNVQAIVVNGGTGVSMRDLTLEAVAPFEEKILPGFGELFRMLSFDEIGSAAFMSRAVAFVTKGKAVFCIPGSEKAVRLAMTKLIAPELGHLVWEARR
jgi:molybdenum cofactor biosynthesis protein B